jgi:TatD DNase family protein
MFLDTHCHLDFNCFADCFDELLQRSAEKKIVGFVIPATERVGWNKIKKLSATYPSVYHALGIHPHFLSSFKNTDISQLKLALQSRSKQCIAVGEIGLDKFALASSQQQEFVFIAQLKLAQQYRLPVLLHIVKKQQRVLAILDELDFQEGGVYHAFSGSLEIANEFIKRGFKIGIGAVITYPNATKTKMTVSKLPIESIVLETDAADQALFSQSAAENYTYYFESILEALLRIRTESRALLVTHLYKNSLNLNKRRGDSQVC